MPAWEPREHLTFAVSYALARLPKSWLARLQKDRPADEVAQLCAERIVAHIELSNVHYEMGPSVSFTGPIGGKYVKPEGDGPGEA